MTTCAVETCERPSRSKGLCSMHYSRLRRTGTTETTRPEWNMTIEEKFWAKVQKGAPGECWEWTAAKQPSGHARFRDEHGKTVSAYGWLWERTNGPLPQGMVLDHFACDNPGCVNPDHIRPASIGENVLRGRSESARHARKTHCDHGHLLAGDNLRIVSRSKRGAGKVERICVTCARRRARETAKRKRAK